MIDTLIPLIKSQITGNALFGGALWLSVLAGIGYYSKFALVRVYTIIKRNLVHTIYFDQENLLFPYFEKWLHANYPDKYKIVEARIGRAPGSDDEIVAVTSDVSPADEMGLKYYQLADSFFIRYNGSVLHIEKSRERLENASKLSSVYLNSFKIRGLFGKRKMKKLVEHLHANIKADNLYVCSLYRKTHNSWSYLDAVEERSLDSVVLPVEIKKTILDSVNKFLTEKEIYKKRGIPYKLGILLYGSPGNGKTSFIKAIAHKFDRDIYMTSLTESSDWAESEFIHVMSRLPKNAIVLLEDVDCFFKDQRDLKAGGISFSALLNCLDGLYSKSGIITIMTTNHIDRLDPALIRSGRMDAVVEITNPSLTEIKQLYLNFFEEDLDIDVYENTLAMADVQQIFIECESKRHLIPIKLKGSDDT